MIRSRARAASFLTLAFLALLAPTAARAQGFHSVYTPDGFAVWAVGDSSGIYLSTDTGLSYQRLTTGTVPLYSVTARAFVTLAVGAGGLIYRSINSGGNWTTETLAGTPDLYGVALPSLDAAYVVGAGGTVFKSEDGGATWISQTSGTVAALRAVRFVDDLNGWIVGDGGTVLHTTNGGATWDPILVPTANDLCAVDQVGLTVWIGGRLGTCIKSGNGGSNWEHVNLKLDAHSDVRALMCTLPGTVYVVGGGGFVRRTTDGGETWTFLKHFMLSRATGFSGFGQRLYLCSDRHRVVFRATDFGDTWGIPLLATFSRTFVQKLNLGGTGLSPRGNTFTHNPQNPRSIFCAIGNQVYKSLDEGDTWSAVGNTMPSTNRVNAFIVSPKDSNLWVAAVTPVDPGRILRSTNAGTTWTTPLTKNFGEFGVPIEMHPDNPDTLYFGPSCSGLWRSTDFGATWSAWTTSVVPPGNNASCPFRSPCDLVVVPDSAEVILVGDGETGSTNPPARVYKSTDAGLTFSLEYEGDAEEDASEMPGMAAGRLRNNVVVGTHWTGGGIVRSQEHGSNWSKVHDVFVTWGVDIAKDDPNVFMVGLYGGSGNFYLSTDGGDTWVGAQTLSVGANYGLYARDRELMLISQGPATFGPGIWKLKSTYTCAPVSNQTVNVNVPNGGEIWPAGTYHSISWSHLNLAIARIEYRKSPLDPWQLVVEVPGYHAGYDWLVPNDATYEAQIRISDGWDGVPVDESDNQFTILQPLFTALPDPLDMGIVQTGATVDDTLHLENPGSQELTITSITSDHPEFIVSRTSLSIPPSGSDTITVIYNPLAAGRDTATLSFVGNNMAEPNLVKVYGDARDNVAVGDDAPVAFALHQNAPNPFGGLTHIRYALPMAADVTLEVFDLRGRRVATLVRGRQEPGEHAARFGSGAGIAGGGRVGVVPAGVYFYRLRAGEFMATRKMLYVR